MRNLQTAVLLTGVNQTDHIKQFETLSLQIANNCSSIVTILQSRDCPTVKSAVEALVAGFISQDEDLPKLKKNQLTIPVLEAWYDEQNAKPSLVVMIADFELFNATCIQELISILCSCASRLPLVVVLGIATSFTTLHSVLPSHISNKLDSNVFQSDSSTSMLNRILEEVILTHHSPFHLSGKSFKILLDIFLFYDYSLHSFIQGYKLFMLEHFSTRPLSARLHRLDPETACFLTREECNVIRSSCLSFRSYVDSQQNAQNRIDLISNDDYLRGKMTARVFRIERHWFQFFWSLRLLTVLLEDLPRNELGKLLRELYPICVTSNVTQQEEYKECFKLLKFSSKDKFLAKMDKIIAITEKFLADDSMEKPQKVNLNKVEKNFRELRERIEKAGMSPTKAEAPKAPSTPTTEVSKKGTMSRQAMMEKLKESAKNNQQRVLVDYEVQLNDCVNYLNQVMTNYLRPISEAPPLHEFSVFTDSHSVRRQIVGAPRGALHNALSNPQHYLQCSCCAMSEGDRILPTLPDIAIGYKLHLECNKFINLYDWLQAFAMVIETNEDEDDISPEIQ